MKHSYFILEPVDGRKVLATCHLLLGPKTYIISEVQVSRWGRNRGFARRVLALVCNDADQEGVTLQLSPIPQEEDIDYDRLVKLYREFNFKFLGGRMVRRPQK